MARRKIGLGAIIAVGAVAFVALRGRAGAAPPIGPPPSNGPGNGLVPEIGKITIGKLGTHAVRKTIGVGAISVSGSIQYRGPANTLEYNAVVVGGSVVTLPRQIAVPESRDFVSYSFSTSGFIPSTATAGLKTAFVSVKELKGGTARQASHTNAYEYVQPIPSSEIGGISATFSLQGRRRRGFMRAR